MTDDYFLSFGTMVVMGAIALYLLLQILRVGEATHKIVNSQRSTMLRLVATLSRRIANDNPLDKSAQLEAEAAEKDAVQ